EKYRSDIKTQPLSPFTIISEFIKYQLSCEKEYRVNDAIMQKLVEKIGFDAIGKIILEMGLIKAQPQTAFAARRIQAIATITEFPTLCLSILSHYKVRGFSELEGKPFYNLLMALFVDPEVVQDFGMRFDAAVAASKAPQNKRLQL
ncbi:MAG TPA: hypothetical protein PLV31_06695, partial [Gammaproteobacteria bacterium]|nr:hypothetical protein [Gammaproteobacteria bacterium]